ncbi:MAG: glycoside hydrolase family 44 protein [Myxococcota bacterium]
MFFARGSRSSSCPLTSISSLLVSLTLSSLTVSCIKRENNCVPTGPGGAQASTATGSSNTPLPPGKSLLPAAALPAFVVQGESSSKVAVSTVAVEGQPFPDALRAEIKEASNSEWSVQLQAPTAAPVAKGDAVLASFYVRLVKPNAAGIGETQFVFEKAGSPYTKSVTYNVRLTPEWRKVEVRFLSAEDYGVAGAQMIFRLGYDPETFEVGGIQVQNFGKVPLGSLPSSQGRDHQVEVANKPKEEKITVVDGGELAFRVNPTKVLRAISPLVYGINSQNFGQTGATVRRMGGNRGSVYNWETNASNAGNDYRHQNDDWSCSVMGYQTCTQPGAQYAEFVKQNKAAGADSIVTIPMIDWVSADKSGPVSEEEKAPSKRFVRSYPKKKGALSVTPDLNDNAVYEDEFVNLLVSKFGKAAQGGTKFYSLDNEPALWPSTHPRVHPERTTYKEMVERTEATAMAITAVDPSAFLLGGVMFGWSEYQSLSDAPDAAEHNAKYGTYLDFFLASMKELEQKHGRRLVHALDVHWYPEARGAKRITDKDNSRATVDARLQAPRSLWDPEYKERSWIIDKINKPIRFIPYLLETINKRYPGTKLTMTEYDFGASDHISGGLAQIDVLGIFGREGMYMANYWGNGPGNGSLQAYIETAFKLYRNYDGKGARFGDTAVSASVADLKEGSIYAATDSKKPGTLYVIVINKDQGKRFKAKVTLEGATKYTKADVFVVDGSSPAVRPDKPVTVANNALEYQLGALSAALFVVQ